MEFINKCHNGDIESAQIIYYSNKISSCYVVEAICASCENGNIDMVKWLLDLNIRRPNTHNTFLFYLTVKKNYSEISKMIYEKYLNTKENYLPILNKICSFGNLEIAKWLYEFFRIDESDYTQCLISALDHEQNQIVNWLCKLKISTGIKISIGSHYQKIPSILCNDDLDLAKQFLIIIPHKTLQLMDFNDIFQNMCKHGNILGARWLHDSSYELITDYNSAYLSACAIGNIEIVQWLHSLNVYIDNDSALISACENGHLNIVEWLHSVGANIHTMKNIAFGKACIGNYFEIALFLYENGANVLQGSKHFFTKLIDNINEDMLFWLHSLDDMIYVKNIIKIAQTIFISRDANLDNYSYQHIGIKLALIQKISALLFDAETCEIIEKYGLGEELFTEKYLESLDNIHPIVIRLLCYRSQLDNLALLIKYFPVFEYKSAGGIVISYDIYPRQVKSSAKI